MSERAEAVVSGKVQGISYRYFTCDAAERLGVVGEVKNLPDGTVRVIAEGSRDILERLIKDLETGPVLARVEQVAVTWLPATGEYTSFSITR